MTELLTAAQMRAIEEAAIASGEVTGLELMERAGKGVVEAIFEEWPELRVTSHRAVVLCGPGNNGGDGFVVARLLKDWGWEVEVFLYGAPEKMPPDARLNYERWVAMGEVRGLPNADFDKADLVVDAIFGIGLSRAFEVPAALNQEFHHFMADGYWWTGKLQPPYIVALDVVSEVDADSGRVLEASREFGGEMGAHLTVTFHRPKVGHYLSDGPQLCSKLAVVDIGLEAVPKDVVAHARPHLAMLAKRSAHKYSHGHALIVSGDHGRSGAARLAARGALRIGAGVVTVASPPDAMAENAARLDAIMLREVSGAEDLAKVMADKRINALCLGPGIGTGGREAGVLEAALANGGVEPHPTVLDADALTILSQRPDLFAALHEACVLTPHAGEFARLFPDVAAKLHAPATKGPAYSKVDATREAAARAGCVVLFKGPDTVIADPSGRAAINAAVYDRAAPWLATAGSGDVLAGFITGLLARGFAPFDAACTGAWLHVECARSFGPGLIAEDLPEELPKVFRALGL
ncbi:NAD(P)H-hydrate dehydratase [Tabrizicola sp.]|uniref:NAD(P)H-hydrate dehydratase n=1 Tax=Tabrizicola sp. TaxID=2005166 RepID=UPI003D2DDCF3